MYSCETMSKDACIKRMVAVRNYSTNTIMEKNARGRGKVKDTEFSANVIRTL